MFGILRPCRHRLPADLHSSWIAQLCGLCLALRDEHGHAARFATNFDALVISGLVEAQRGSEGGRRKAKACALRGMRTASVAVGDGARLAAAVSLALASLKVADHLADDELPALVPTGLARRWSGRCGDAAASTAQDLGFDIATVTAPLTHQTELEDQAGPGTSLLTLTRPTEDATGAAFARTAVLADRPSNVGPLQEAGRLFGRIVHLLDAVEDQVPDAESGRFNPITATATDPASVRGLCDDAMLGVRMALRDVHFVDGRLVHTLLVHELVRAVDRVFAGGSASCTRHGESNPRPTDADAPGTARPAAPDADPGLPGDYDKRPDRRHPGPLAGCLGWLALCGTCQACCAEEYTHPCTGERRRGSCRGGCKGCDGCGDCCDCCDCCDCDC